MPKLTKKEKIFETVSKWNYDEKLRYAKKTEASEHIHLALASDPNLKIRKALAENRKITQAVEYKLIESVIPKVEKEDESKEAMNSEELEILEILAKKKETKVETIEKLTTLQYTTVLNNIAKRDKIDAKLIRKIYDNGKEGGIYLNMTLARRKECPVDILQQITNDVMKLDQNELITILLRKLLIGHELCTDEIRQQLAKVSQ